MTTVAVGQKDVSVSPAKRVKTDEWPIYLQVLERFGFPTMWALILCSAIATAAYYIRCDVILPAMSSVIKTHESIRESVSEQTRISSEMVNIQKQNTAILVEIKDSLTEGRR